MITPRASSSLFQSRPIYRCPFRSRARPLVLFNCFGPYFLTPWTDPFGPISLESKVDPASSSSRPSCFPSFNITLRRFSSRHTSAKASRDDGKGRLLEIRPFTSSRSRFKPAKNSYPFVFQFFLVPYTVSWAIPLFFKILVKFLPERIHSKVVFHYLFVCHNLVLISKILDESSVSEYMSRTTSHTSFAMGRKKKSFSNCRNHRVDHPRRYH